MRTRLIRLLALVVQRGGNAKVATVGRKNALPTLSQTTLNSAAKTSQETSPSFQPLCFS